MNSKTSIMGSLIVTQPSMFTTNLLSSLSSEDTLFIISISLKKLVFSVLEAFAVGNKRKGGHAELGKTNNFARFLLPFL